VVNWLLHVLCCTHSSIYWIIYMWDRHVYFFIYVEVPKDSCWMYYLLKHYMQAWMYTLCIGSKSTNFHAGVWILSWRFTRTSFDQCSKWVLDFGAMAGDEIPCLMSDIGDISKKFSKCQADGIYVQDVLNSAVLMK